ncbi:MULTISPECIES: hypothetical protein [unclassified Gordonia (in: high G+C Gram-positive bacteria)]
MSAFHTIAAAANRAVIPMLGLPVIGGVLAGSMTVVTYTGRKSGTTVRFPVAYRRRPESPDEVMIGVAIADKKTWWRNFTGEGSPLSLTLDGVDRPGHGTARRDEQGRVTVRVVLDPAQ